MDRFHHRRHLVAKIAEINLAYLPRQLGRTGEKTATSRQLACPSTWPITPNKVLVSLAEHQTSSMVTKYLHWAY